MATKKFRDLLPADAIPEFVQQIDEDEANQRAAAQADKIENTPYIVPVNNGYGNTGTEDSSDSGKSPFDQKDKKAFARPASDDPEDVLQWARQITNPTSATFDLYPNETLKLANAYYKSLENGTASTPPDTVAPNKVLMGMGTGISDAPSSGGDGRISSKERAEEDAEARTRSTNAWAKRRSEDAANLRADKIASQFGVDLWRNPQNYKTLRDEATSAVDEDGNYTQPAMRKSLGSADAYYDYINNLNEQAMIEYIHDLAKNQAINDKKSASDEYGTYNLDDIYSGLSEERAALEAALASARSEAEITAAEKAIAEWEKKAADADANYAEWKKGRDDTLSPFDQKLADIDQTYRDLMGIGNADGTGVSDAPDSGGGGRTSPEEDNEAPAATDAQGEEFYKWLATTPSGQAFYDYWHNLGYDFDRANKGWSRMRTMNDADLWGNVYGYGDLSKYGIDDFTAPEGWTDRLVNSGFDVNSDDLVDQLMDYMFNTHALRRSDLLTETPDWDRYGSLADQQEFMEYLFENGMMPYRNSVKDTVYKSGLDEKDIAQLYMASRLSQLGLDGYTVEEIIDLMNRSLERAGDAYMLGLMDEGDEGNAFHSEDQRSNRMKYNPTMLFTDDLNQYSYSDAFRNNNDEYAGPYDLLDWNMLDTYYQLANDLAKEQGRKVGLATR